jgi:hypothetical protein
LELVVKGLKSEPHQSRNRKIALSVRNLTIAALLSGSVKRLSNNREDIAFPHQEQFVFADFEFFSGIGQEQHFVSFLDLEGSAGSIVEEFSITDADDSAACRFVFGGVRQIESAFGFFFGGLTPDDDSVSERLQFCTFA